MGTGLVNPIVVKQYPAATAKHLNVPLVVEGKQIDDQIPQRFFAANPRHKAVYTPSPPSGSRRRSISVFPKVGHLLSAFPERRATAAFLLGNGLLLMVDMKKAPT